MRKVRIDYVWVAAIFCLIGAPHLRASAVQITSPGQLSPSDVTAIFPGTPGSFLPSPLPLTAGANTITYSLSDPVATFYRYNSSGVNNDFPAGTSLIDTNGAYGPYIDIRFSQGVSEFGFYVQSEGTDTVTFTLNAFDKSTKLLNFQVGPVDNTSTRGQAAFIGAVASAGDDFTTLHLSSVSSDPAYSNFVIFGPPTISAPAPVPEPGSLSLLLSALIGFAVFGRTRRRPASH